MIFEKYGTTGLAQVWNKLYKAETICRQKVQFDVGRFHGEDWLFNLRVFNNSDTVAFVEDAPYEYTVTHGSLGSKFHVDGFKQILKNLEIFRDEFTQFDYEGFEYADYFIREVRTRVHSILCNTSTWDETKTLLEKMFHSKAFEKYYPIYKSNTRIVVRVKANVRMLLSAIRHRIKVKISR